MCNIEKYLSEFLELNAIIRIIDSSIVLLILRLKNKYVANYFI